MNLFIILTRSKVLLFELNTHEKDYVRNKTSLFSATDYLSGLSLGGGGEVRF